MIVTEHFVYIHTSRTAGTFLNKLILEHMPGAQMIQYHGHLRDLPRDFSHLPVIGFVRNPWDWYVSMYFDYRRKQQYVFQIMSQGGVLGFEETVARFLNLGDRSAESQKLLTTLENTAPAVINAQTPPRHGRPGLRSKYFANFPENFGYYSWLFQLMFVSSKPHRIHIGRFENLREEALRLFEETGAPITEKIRIYLKDTGPLNDSKRPVYYAEGYTPSLRQLVADKEKDLINQFDYEFSGAEKYPKTDYFLNLGSVQVDALIERVKKIPEDLWQSENEEKPNKKIKKLNDTRHIMFRFIKSFGSAFDYDDFPLWEEWQDDLLPIMETAAKRLGCKDYRFPRVMFARLPAGGEISPHKDTMASHYVHKLHVPLITNPDTIFHVGTKSKNLTVGEIVEVNNKRSHAVYNKGKQDRVHLIFECYSMDDYNKSD
jgi:hypothetical protein